MAAAQIPFLPSQALPFDGALLEEIQGGVTNLIAKDIVAALPAFTPASRIHDNGCGYGAVTEEIMVTDPPSGLRINATDINPTYLSELQVKLDAHPRWPVTVAEMDAQALDGFEDATFSHSVTNFVFLGLPDPVAAAREIRRTVAPGGTAAVSVWEDVPWMQALHAAHYATRGADAPADAMFMFNDDFKGKKLGAVLERGGWAPDSIALNEMSAWLRVKDLRRWATLAWSLMGKSMSTGWTRADEERWDEAIATIVKHMDSDEDWHYEKGGEHYIRMVATVAFLRK